MEGSSYCLLCQEDHIMSDVCVLLHAKCRGCGKTGHFRKDCPDLKILEPLAFNCSWVRDAGEELQESHQTPSEIIESLNSNAAPILSKKRSREEIILESGKNNSLVSFLRRSKRQKQTSSVCTSLGRRTIVKVVLDTGTTEITDACNDSLFAVNCHSVERENSDKIISNAHELIEGNKVLKDNFPIMESVNLGQKNASTIEQNEEESEEVATDIDNQEGCLFSQEEVQNQNEAVIIISDDENINTIHNNDAISREIDVLQKVNCEEIENSDFYEILPEIDQKTRKKKPTRVSKLYENRCNFESAKLEKECPYTVVSIHIECFRSSHHSFTKLTQVGCATHGPDADTFFATIKPVGIEDYIDNYKVGGDLLQALHMTREDDGVFLFRSKFEAIVESTKRVCVEENEALDKLLEFLQKYTNCIILGVDEDTIAVLVEKLQNRDEKKAKTIVGFTYWKRVLKHLEVDGYKNIDLEEYHAKLFGFGETLPTFDTALDIAKVLLNSVRKVSILNKSGRKGLDAGFYKLCKRISFLNHPRKPKMDEEKIENIEVYSSFRPFVSASFSAEKLEQIVVSSESDSEPEVEEINLNLTNSAGAEAEDESQNNFGPRVRQVIYPRITSTTTREQPRTSSRNQIISDWEIVKKYGGSVICPYQVNHKGNSCAVKYTNFYRHITRCQPMLINWGKLCPACKKSVLPSQIEEHMNICAPQGDVISSLPGAIVVNNTASASATPTPDTATVTPISSDQTPVSAPPLPALPSSQILLGLSVEEYPWLDGYHRSLLETYLVNNFIPSRWGEVNCLWMYKNYQVTMRFQGQLKVLSPARFLVLVNESCVRRWNFSVIKPEELGYHSGMETRNIGPALYFKGLEFGIDRYH